MKRNYVPTNYALFTYSPPNNLQTFIEMKKQCVTRQYNAFKQNVMTDVLLKMSSFSYVSFTISKYVVMYKRKIIKCYDYILVNVP